MKITIAHLSEPLETAVSTALVADAWIKFAQEVTSGNKNPSVSGSFSVPVGHYFKFAPNDHILEVTVNISGREFPFEGGGHYGPAQALLDKIVGRAKHDLTNKELTHVNTVSKVSEVASLHGFGRFSIEATASIVLKSNTVSVDLLTETRKRAGADLARINAAHPENVRREKESYKNRKSDLERSHKQGLAELDANFALRRSELEAEIAKLDEQLKAAKPAS